MKPLAAIPAAVVQNIRGVFCDVDDTLTSEGKPRKRAASTATNDAWLTYLPTITSNAASPKGIVLS